MATYSTYPDGKPILGASGGNAAGFPMVTVLEGTFDASKLALVAADVVQLINIPAGTLVHATGYEVLVGDATETMNIGDGGNVSRYFTAADVGTTGNKTALGIATGYFYSAADTIDLTVPAADAADVLKIRVFVVCSILGMTI